MAVQVNGFANQVLFRQACEGIPKGAVCLEIGPHSLMRSPLRQNRRAFPVLLHCLCFQIHLH